MIPNTFEAWRRCIVEDCKIDLTPAFAKSRLAIYEDSDHPETIKFIALYGAQHMSNIISWLKKI